MKIDGSSKLIIAMLFSMSIWGGSWTSSKVLADKAPAEVLAFWRFLLTTVSFLPVMILLKKPFKLSRKPLLFSLGGALCMVSYNEGLFLGLRYGFASGGGVLVTTLNPILTFVFAAIIFRKKLSGRDISALFIGFTGGMILLEIWKISYLHLFHSGNLFFLLCTSSWALLTITSQGSQKWMHAFTFSFYVYTFAAVMDLFIALPKGIMIPVGKGLPFWGNIIYMSVGSTTIATTIYFIASMRMGSEKASSFIFTVPATAVLFAWIFLGEIPHFSTIVGGLIALAAVYMINRKQRIANSQ